MSLHFFWCSVFCFAHPSNEPAFNTEIVATVVEHHGNIQMRADAKPTWRRLGGIRNLRAGDRIFAGKDSAIKIQYTKLKDTFISLGELTILQVANEPPSSSHLLKGIPSLDGELTLPQAPDSNVPDLPFMDLVKGPETESKQPAQKNESRVSNLKVEYPVTFVDAKRPQGNLFFQDALLPKNVRLEFDAARKARQTFYGTLWSIEPERKPVWSSVFSDTTLSVPIKLHGLYIFSASSLDGRTRTRPVVIRAEKESKEILPASLRPRDVVVLP